MSRSKCYPSEAVGSARGRRSDGAIPARSAHTRRTQSAEHRDAFTASLKPMASARSCSSSSRARRWRSDWRRDRCRSTRRSPIARQIAVGARSRARAGHRPSRSQAVEHQAAARWHGEAAGFRPGEGRAARRRGGSARRSSHGDHQPVDDPGAACCRHRRLHEPGASARGARPIGGATSGRLVRCCSRCSRESARSRAATSPKHSLPCCAQTSSGLGCRSDTAPSPATAGALPRSRRAHGGCVTSAKRASFSTICSAAAPAAPASERRRRTGAAGAVASPRRAGGGGRRGSRRRLARRVVADPAGLTCDCPCRDSIRALDATGQSAAIGPAIPRSR